MPNVTVHLEGEEELKAQLEALGRAARGTTLERAAMAGAEVIRADAARRAPGPYIEAEVTESADLAIEVGIGPDKDHWYYKFFETGVSGFVIDKVTGRTSRTGDRGRPIRGDKKALAFDGVVTMRVNRGPMAAQPFLRPAMDARQDAAVKAMGGVLRREIERVADSG